MKFIFFIALVLSLTSLEAFPFECEGTTCITYLDEKEHKEHTITCYETLSIDLENNILQCLKKNIDSPQVEFKDETREIYANNLLVNYNYKNSSLDLDTITIFGNVKCTQMKLDEDNVMQEAQFTLADKLIYTHSEERIVFYSNEKQNVLYYDQVNNYQISAPSVIVRRDPLSNKPIVDGQGHVRFTFKEEELMEFKKHFLGMGEKNVSH
jgi:hypothetical protein